MPRASTISGRPILMRPQKRRRIAKTTTMARKAKGGIGLSIPGLFDGRINWRHRYRYPRSARAARYVSAYAKPSAKASRVMNRALQYGQSFNTGALAQGLDDGVVCLKHREFLGVIDSSISFTTNTYDLNPGLSRLMPWGSAIANNFQQYKIRAMAFEFVSTSATALSTGTNNALGQVAIATQYDSISPEFRNLNDMLNSQFATSTKISSDLVHPIEAEKVQTPTVPLYTRSGRAPGDIRLYDLGRTTVAVYGCQANGNQIGQIWVSYDIELYKPITYGLDGGNAESAFLTCTSTASQDFQTGPSLNAMGGASFTNFDSIGVTLDLTANAQKIILPPGSSGYYLLNLAYYSNNATPTTFIYQGGNFATTNCDVQSQFFNKGTTTIAGSNSALTVPPPSGQNACFAFIFNVPDPSLPAIIQFTNAGVPWFLQPMVGNPVGSSVLNILISQLNVGMDNFLEVGAGGCCDQLSQLQAQIELLQSQVLLLQNDSDSSGSDSDGEIVINNYSSPPPPPTIAENDNINNNIKKSIVSVNDLLVESDNILKAAEDLRMKHAEISKKLLEAFNENEKVNESN